MIFNYYKFLFYFIEKNVKDIIESSERGLEEDKGSAVVEVKKKDSLFKTVNNVMFMGLGTSALAIVKIPYNISIIMTPICIFAGGVANIWSYHILGDLYEKEKINNYEALTLKICGRGMQIFLFITLNIYTVGLVLIHEVLTYRLLGGIINVIGGYNFDSMLDFLSDTYWNELYCKAAVNFGLAILVYFPLCLIKDMKKLNISSSIGVFTTAFIFLIVLVQFPGYLIYYLNNDYKEDDKNTHINYYNLGTGWTGRLLFLQAFSQFFFCFTGHNGLLPALENLENPIPSRRSKLYNMAIGFDMLIYVIIALCGYLSTPADVVEIVFERKRIWGKDILMTIGRICLVPMAITKLQVNHNIWRISLLSTLGIPHETVSLKLNMIISGATLAVTTLVASLYQNITGYISLIGCFCVVFPAFFIPSILYMKTCGLPKSHWKVWSQIALGSILCIIGYIAGVFGLIDLIKGN